MSGRCLALLLTTALVLEGLPVAWAETAASRATAVSTDLQAPTQTQPGRRRATKKPRRRPPATVVREPTAAPSPQSRTATDPTLREYEIRLHAHRRELMQREQALRIAEGRIVELTREIQSRPPVQAVDRSVLTLDRVSRERDEALAESRRHSKRAEELESRLRAATLPPPASAASAPSPTPSALSAEDADLVASLRHDLDVERDNRKTLEEELQRLVATSRPDEQRQLSRSLQSAKAEILLLRDRLEQEEHAREALEVVFARVRTSAAIGAEPDWIARFETTLRERQQQADRLRGELRVANETIVSLRQKLEMSPPPGPASPAFDELRAENDSLRLSLRTAEQANADLRTQAELAARLADMLYGDGAR